ncbi:antitoxin Xre/MbcA/ParS toxin-binding domain-containing protein [Gordonia sp. DT30]|uniref:antitoxin Xre/MbcA/ParS toxin-binding domain-containing protein n=1 Tax=unclassified Gordonia (in: high G+C Gram-positive bacteria) TaxID=2657482 RepID=UPI003CFA1442
MTTTRPSTPVRQQRSARGRSATTKKSPGSAGDDPVAAFRVQALSSAFSGARLAALIGVSPSQPSRWASGKERPGPAAAAALIDLDHVYARARLVWGPEAAAIWIESPNAFLDGARPVDVLQQDGVARVLDALDAETWGGAA